MRAEWPGHSARICFAHGPVRMIARHGFDPSEFEKERNLHLKKLAKEVL